MLFPTIRNMLAAAFSRVDDLGEIPKKPPWKTLTVHSDRAVSSYNVQSAQEVQFVTKKMRDLFSGRRAKLPGTYRCPHACTIQTANQLHTVRTLSIPAAIRPSVHCTCCGL